MRLCTIVTKDHLPWARVLADSWAQHGAGEPCTVLLVDEPDGCFDPAQERFDVLLAADLGIGPELWRMALRYEAFELAMALKPWLLRRELQRDDRVVYLDADVRVFAPLDPVAAALDDHEIALTPHFLDPMALDGQSPSEPDIVKAGAYNAGFVAVRRGEQSERFLDWWASRLRTGSRVDIASGIFVDQHWLDLVPGLFGGVCLLRDRGCNVAYWNLAERPLARVDGALTAGGTTLRFLHFSGFDPEQPAQLSVYGTRASALHDPILGELCERQADGLAAAGLREAKSWPYSWQATGGGIALCWPLRRLLDRSNGPDASIFTVAGEREWLEWLNEPATPGGRDGVTRLLAVLHASRADLREQFPDLRCDGPAYLRWVREHGTDEIEMPPALVPIRATPAQGAGELQDIHSGDDLGVGRGEAIVCIPLYGAHDLFLRCLSSILAHTPRTVPILIADDASPDPASRAFAETLACSGALEHRLLWLRQKRNLGFVENVNAVLGICAPADTVVVNSDCVVAPGWFEGMRHAAYDDTNVATATALTNHGTIVSVPARNGPRRDLPQDVEFLGAARTVRATSARLRPRIPTCVGHCFYVRREALELVGPFDPAFSPAYGEEVDFSQRCTLHGLVHVVADDVLVLHRQGGSLNDEGEAHPIQLSHDRIIDARYPYYQRLIQETAKSSQSRLARSLGSARRALGELTVTIDGRSLGPILTGVQLHVLELIGALHRTGATALRIVVPPDLGDYARAALETIGDVELIDETVVQHDVERSAVVHRPLQVSNVGDLELMSQLGDRAVLTQQDLIAYRNPGYFPGFTQFSRYRRLARRALAYADAVVFVSHHAARDAVREDLVVPERARIAYNGVDHQMVGVAATPRPPAGCERLGEDDMLLCLGTDFRHKNRLFALRLVEQLQLRHNWEGRLVFAGPRVQDGSSAGDEAAFLAAHPLVSDSLIGLPAIDEDEKAWLYERATALLYPTLYEGFGLMPFEAANAGTPALWAAQTSLAEVLPAEAATLVPWDPAASADAVIDVLRDRARAAELLDHVRRAGACFRWDRTASELVDIYREAGERPAREARLAAIETDELEAERDDLERKYAELLAGFTDDGRRLVGSGGLLSPSQQRVLRRALECGGPLTALSGALRLVGRVRPTAADLRPLQTQTDGEALRLHWEWLNRNHMKAQLAATDPLVLTPEPS
jgi:glycosyltransferase involved in cell wall biosynthesis/GT2 family glycosyltransferase